MAGPIGLFTCLVILVTCVSSIMGFSSRGFEDKYVFHPESVLAGKQYYRLLTAGFLHADWSHLGLNMFSLYLFGSTVELLVGHTYFLLLYLGAIVGGNLLSLYVHRHHEYLAYGASGGVCGIIFAQIVLWPGSRIVQFPIPFAIPGWLYAILFLAASFFALRAGRDNIGHDAHLGGAIIGLLLTAGIEPQLVLENLRTFLALLAVAVLLLLYLWFNPMFLPLASFSGLRFRVRQNAHLPKHRQEALEVDKLLEKVSRKGLHSLKEEERALLERVSEKYQRRADSKKPESDLLI